MALPIKATRKTNFGAPKRTGRKIVNLRARAPRKQGKSANAHKKKIRVVFACTGGGLSQEYAGTFRRFLSRHGLADRFESRSAGLFSDEPYDLRTLKGADIIVSHYFGGANNPDKTVQYYYRYWTGIAKRLAPRAKLMPVVGRDITKETRIQDTFGAIFKNAGITIKKAKKGTVTRQR
jgi:hypothetical protein